jgi:hypothetical protein
MRHATFIMVMLSLGVGGCQERDTSQIRQLTAREAKELVAKYSGGKLNLNGLLRLDSDAAEELSHFRGTHLYLNRLDSIGGVQAQFLADFDGEYLSLDGFRSIPEGTARTLHRFKCTALAFHGLLGTLRPEDAEALCKFNGIVSLGGITVINEDIARILTTFKGQGLYLKNVEKLGGDAGKILGRARFRGFGLVLGDLKDCTAGNLAALRANPTISISSAELLPQIVDQATATEDPFGVAALEHRPLATAEPSEKPYPRKPAGSTGTGLTTEFAGLTLGSSLKAVREVYGRPGPNDLAKHKTLEMVDVYEFDGNPKVKNVATTILSFFEDKLVEVKLDFDTGANPFNPDRKAVVGAVIERRNALSEALTAKYGPPELEAFKEIVVINDRAEMQERVREIFKNNAEQRVMKDGFSVIAVDKKLLNVVTKKKQAEDEKARREQVRSIGEGL